MIQKISEKIDKATDIAVLAHINEDADALGSIFAMCRVLNNMGKNAVCFLNTEPEERLKFLCDSYFLYDPQKKYEFDLCIALDSADKERLGERVKIFDDAKATICIDHHVTNSGYAEINIIEPDKSSTGEVLCGIFKKLNIKLDAYSAKCLYAAIASDSGCFKYSSATASTLRTAADLLEYDFDHAEVARLLFDTESIENIKLKGYVMNNIESYEDGKIQLVVTDEDILERFSVEEKNVSDLVNIPRMVSGCEIAIELKKRNGKIRLSLRSYRLDISEIAKHFGGGGHKLAAGAEVIAATMEEAKQKVLEQARIKLTELN